MNTDATCPECHAPLPADAPAGLCPRCLFKSAAGMGSEPTVITGGDMPNISDPADVAARLPQYEILELLGKGGMGVVYKARQRQLDRIVALKILPPGDALSPDFVERFRREAQALAKLSHPNIVAVHDFGESGGLYYFAMEYVAGANLREVLRAKKFTAAEALAIVPRICDALQYAHEEGVVHRDIKPENLLMDAKGRVKIADFGLAKLLRREPSDPTLTMSGMTLGTPRYMAPEQLDKPETVDHRADIYSLGVVFYEMLTGEVPMGRFAPPSEKVQVDVKLDEIVLRSLERDVERRYQHASEVKTAVESVTSKPVVQPQAARVPATTIIVMIAVVAAITVLAWFPKKEHPQPRTTQVPAEPVPQQAPANPETPPDLRFSIQQDRAQLPATATPGRQEYAFKFSGPADHTLNVWMEVWQEGKMEWVSDFDFEAKPKASEPLTALLKVTAMDGATANPGSKGRTRLDWTMNCGGSDGKSHTANALIADLSAGMGATYSTWDRQPKPQHPRPGETVTVLGITGYKLSNFRSVAPAHTETDLLKRWPNAAVLIRARLSPARPGELGDSVGFATRVSDQAFEKRTFAQFQISKQLAVDLSHCPTPTEAHAALVAAASTPGGSARVAQMVDEFGSDNIGYMDHFKIVAEPMLAMWWKLRKREPATAEEIVSLLENFITALSGPGSHSVWWHHGEPITKWAEGPSLNDSFSKKLRLTTLQTDEINKLFKKYANEASALRRRHTKVTRNDQGHVLVTTEPYSEECLELARKMVAELGGIVMQDIVPAVKVGALPMAVFGNAGECRETVELKKDSDGVYVIRIMTSDWVPAGEWRGDNTTGWGSKDINLAFGSYKMYWTEE